MPILTALALNCKRPFTEGNPLRTIDLFCGAGGSSWGARLAGAEIVAGFDAWDLAGATFMANFPEATFFPGYIESHDVAEVHRRLGDIDLVLASPECTNHSPAKGGGPRCEKSKETAFQVIRFAAEFMPRWIVVENVISMRRWTRYQEFLKQLQSLGYFVNPLVLNARNFNVPQSRERLFLLCDREGEPNKPKPRTTTFRPASSILLNGAYPYSKLRTERRAVATILRAERGIAEMGTRPFLLVYYGSDGAGGWQRLDRPLRTITTLDRFAHVTHRQGEHVMRMLQIPELKAAMGMPRKFKVPETPRRDGIRMIGNAVCPPVMRSVIHHLTS